MRELNNYEIKSKSIKVKLIFKEDKYSLNYSFAPCINTNGEF